MQRDLATGRSSWSAVEALAQHVRAWQRGGDEPFDEVHPVYLRATQELELLALAENQLLLDNAVVARKDYDFASFCGLRVTIPSAALPAEAAVEAAARARCRSSSA